MGKAVRRSVWPRVVRGVVPRVLRVRVRAAVEVDMLGG